MEWPEGYVVERGEEVGMGALVVVVVGLWAEGQRQWQNVE